MDGRQGVRRGISCWIKGGTKVGSIILSAITVQTSLSCKPACTARLYRAPVALADELAGGARPLVLELPCRLGPGR